MSTASTTTPITNNQAGNHKNYRIVKQLHPLREEQTGSIREVGGIAFWTLSSCKPGFGVDQLRDGNIDTYWQSDGPQPHLVNITFNQKMTIKYVCIYIDFTLDESYTPSKISIRKGNAYYDLQEIEQIELEKESSTGWVVISLKDRYGVPIRAFHIQIAILGNQQCGRDTHLRQVKIYSPVNNGPILAANDFSTLSMNQHTNLR